MSLTPEKLEAGKGMIGTTVGSYKIVEQIGAGGMGAVYEAEHSLLGKRAAVKVLLPRMSVDKEIVKRFFNEAKATSLIQHPGIVEVYDYGHLENGDAFIVMELLEGENLGTRLRNIGKLTVNNAIATSRHIAGVLAEAHRHGIIHRDLKPDNIYLVPDAALPRGERAKVLDFGIAKLSGDEGDKLETKTGQILGTPMYMSPEQCKGAGQIDHRSDIYALGCLFYQMLCGRPPFVGEGSGEILAAQIHIDPSPIQAHDPTIPDSVSEVVMKLLNKDPEQRFQTMAELIDALNVARPKTAVDTEPSLATSNEFYAPGENDDTQTMVPINEDSSIHAQVSEFGDNTLDSLSTPPPSRARKYFFWGAAIAVFAIVGGIVVTQGSGASSTKKNTDINTNSRAVEPSSVDPPTEDKALVTPLKIDAGTKPTPVRSAPTNIVLTIDSVPQGAKVYRESDGVRVGITPMTINIRRGNGLAGFLLRKSGYHRAAIELSTSEDGNLVTELQKRGQSQGNASSDDRLNTENSPEDTKVPERDPEKIDPTDVEPKDTNTPAGKDDALDPFASKASLPRDSDKDGESQ